MAEGGASDTLEDNSKKKFVEAIQSESNAEELKESMNNLDLNEKSLTSIFREGGLKAVSSNIDKRLTAWKSEPVNIAVIGRSGVGKSSFINAIRGGVKRGSPIYAPVGHSETTKEATPYRHPDHKLLIFWDLPGAGTSTFPRKKYLTDTRIGFKRYDSFIIMSSERFTEDETWLAEEIRKIGKLFLFVRTKVDTEIDSDRKENKSEANATEVVDIIRKACLRNLTKIDPNFKDLYLIASLDVDNKLLDFDKLCIRLVHGLPELKGEALLYSLNIMTPEMLELKLNSLRKRIWGMGVLSAVSGAVPLPGVGLVADVALIAGEARFYRKQLGITKPDLEAVAVFVGLPVHNLAEKYNLGSFLLTLSSKAIIGLSALTVSEVIEVSVGWAVPVFGSVVGAAVSFTTTVKILRGMLDIMEADAKQVMELLIEHTDKRVRYLCHKDKDGDDKDDNDKDGDDKDDNDKDGDDKDGDDKDADDKDGDDKDDE